MLEVRDLELVEAILSHGNLARGARALGLGQPVLSRRLADLEHRLGGMLFLRHHGRAEPTDLCRALSADAHDILVRVRGLERSLTETRGQQTMDLRIAAGGIAAETSVLTAAAMMLARQPEIRMNIASMNWFDVLHAVREREAELGILDLSALERDTSDLIVEPLQQHPCFFVARSGHLLAKRSEVMLAEILGFPFVFLGKVPKWLVAIFAKAREAARADGAVHPAFPALIHESPTASLQVMLASDAVGVATMPVVQLALRTGEIVVLPWQEPWAKTNFGIIQVRGRSLSSAASTFMKLLREVDAQVLAETRPMLEAAFRQGQRRETARMSGARRADVRQRHRADQAMTEPARDVGPSARR